MDPDRFVQKSSCLFPIPGHHGRLRRKEEHVYVVWILGSPRSNLFPRHVVFLVPQVDLHDALTDGFLGMKCSRPLEHFTSAVEKADVREDRAQTVVGLGLIVLKGERLLEFGNGLKVLEVVRWSPEEKRPGDMPFGHIRI